MFPVSGMAPVRYGTARHIGDSGTSSTTYILVINSGSEIVLVYDLYYWFCYT